MNSPLVAVQAKSMFKSKTFWVNLIVGTIALISEIQAILPDFADVVTIPPIWGRRILLALAILNMILRRISDAPARFRAEDRAVPLERANTTLEYPPRARPNSPPRPPIDDDPAYRPRRPG